MSGYDRGTQLLPPFGTGKSAWNYWFIRFIVFGCLWTFLDHWATTEGLQTKATRTNGLVVQVAVASTSPLLILKICEIAEEDSISVDLVVTHFADWCNSSLNPARICVAVEVQLVLVDSGLRFWGASAQIHTPSRSFDGSLVCLILSHAVTISD